ncbi:MAG: MotA/TolQ/ExbB proton channel family protein [bacterium]|nr:MotA/TolQ/ExbB proton channel family protein [bacterium]
MKMRALLITAALVFAAGAAPGQDMREAALKAAADRTRAETEALAAEQKILADSAALNAKVAELESGRSRLDAELAALERRREAGEKRLADLEKAWAESELEFREISGNVRPAARDLGTMLENSQLTALSPERPAKVAPLLDSGYFPGVDDVAAMTALYFDEIDRAGQVILRDAPFVDRSGKEVVGQVMTIGKFTALYRHAGETGFLRYAPNSARFTALTTLPGRGMRSLLDKYLTGRGESVVVDLSGGAALSGITHRRTFREEMRAGGPLMYPLGLIALASLGLVIYKVKFLNKVGRNTDKYMTRVNRLAAEGNWGECEDIVRRHKGEHSPVNHVIEAGLLSRHEDRETLESVLQESILRELPRLERGLSTLAIFGAVAPLLGLLGTVTGMIETFQVITMFGTGDPKLMSGGISEALITTEVGLFIAIPVMLLHTFLSRRVEEIIGEMEEKAVSLTNIIHKEQRRNADTVAARA